MWVCRCRGVRYRVMQVWGCKGVEVGSYWGLGL